MNRLEVITVMGYAAGYLTGMYDKLSLHDEKDVKSLLDTYDKDLSDRSPTKIIKAMLTELANEVYYPKNRTSDYISIYTKIVGITLIYINNNHDKNLVVDGLVIKLLNFIRGVREDKDIMGNIEYLIINTSREFIKSDKTVESIIDLNYIITLLHFYILSKLDARIITTTQALVTTELDFEVIRRILKKTKEASVGDTVASKGYSDFSDRIKKIQHDAMIEESKAYHFIEGFALEDIVKEYELGDVNMEGNSYKELPLRDEALNTALCLSKHTNANKHKSNKSEVK